MPGARTESDPLPGFPVLDCFGAGSTDSVGLGRQSGSHNAGAHLTGRRARRYPVLSHRAEHPASSVGRPAGALRHGNGPYHQHGELPDDWRGHEDGESPERPPSRCLSALVEWPGGDFPVPQVAKDQQDSLGSFIHEEE